MMDPSDNDAMNETWSMERVSWIGDLTYCGG